MQGGDINFRPGGLIDPVYRPLAPLEPPAFVPPPPPPPPPDAELPGDANGLDAQRTALEALRGDVPGAVLTGPAGVGDMAGQAAEFEAQMLAMMGLLAPGAAGVPGPMSVPGGGAPVVASPTQPFTGVPVLTGMPGQTGTMDPAAIAQLKATAPLTPPKPKKKGGFFSKIGGALKKIGKVVVKALPIVTTVACFIPGINAIALPLKIASMATKAISAYKAIRSGNWLGAVMSVAPGVGGKLGDAFAKFQSSGLGRAVMTARNVVSGYRQGGFAGALAAGGSAFGPTSSLGRLATNAGSVALGYRNGGLTGALGAGGQLVGGSVGRNLGNAALAWQSVRSGNFAGALTSMREGGTLGGSPGFNAMLDRVGGSAASVAAMRNGDFRGAFQSFQAALGQDRQVELARLAATFQATMALRNGDPALAREAEQRAAAWFPQQFQMSPAPR